MLKISDILNEIVQENLNKLKEGLNLTSRAKNNLEQREVFIKDKLNKPIEELDLNVLELNLNKNQLDIIGKKIVDKYPFIEYKVFPSHFRENLISSEYYLFLYLKEDKDVFIRLDLWMGDKKISDVINYFNKKLEENNLNENTDPAVTDIARAKISLSKSKDILRDMGVNFGQGKCSIPIGYSGDFFMNSYVRLIKYNDINNPVLTPGSQKSQDTYRLFGSALNFSNVNVNQNQQPNGGSQITLSGVTFEFQGNMWGKINNKKVWLDNKGIEVNNTVSNILNSMYITNESKNKFLTYNNIDYVKTNIGWATYNRTTGKSGMVITKKNNVQPNQTTLNNEWFKINPIPKNYSLKYNGFDYKFGEVKKIQSPLTKNLNQQLTNEWLKQNSQNQTNQISNVTVLDDISIESTKEKLVNCEIEFYEFDSSFLNKPLQKGFRPRKLTPGSFIKCKTNYYIKILKSYPKMNNCEWGVIYITQLEI